MRKLISFFLMFILIISLSACSSASQQAETNAQPSEDKRQMEARDSDFENEEETEKISDMKINVQIGDKNFTATLEENTATQELIEMMKEEPVTINMNDYAGFEKVGPLGRSLTTSNKQTTTSSGDIVLYSGNQIVMFYGSNSWSYTKIGRIDDLSGWTDALGSGSITAILTIVE